MTRLRFLWCSFIAVGTVGGAIRWVVSGSQMLTVAAFGRCSCERLYPFHVDRRALRRDGQDGTQNHRGKNLIGGRQRRIIRCQDQPRNMFGHKLFECSDPPKDSRRHASDGDYDIVGVSGLAFGCACRPMRCEAVSLLPDLVLCNKVRTAWLGNPLGASGCGRRSPVCGRLVPLRC